MRKLLGLRLAGEDGDASAVAHAQSGGDVLGKDKLDALALDEGNETVAVLADVAADISRMVGKLCAVGLRDIEDVGIAEANQNAACSAW